MRLRFEDCVLDTGRHELTREGRVVALSPKAFLLLQVLAERRPLVVGKADLRRFLWPDEQVGGTTVARLVNEVRSAVGDDAERARVIRTVPRVGYAFSVAATLEAATESRPPIGYGLQWGARQVPLSPGENVLGRAADALISVASAKVSRRHARILVAEGRVVLEDLGSKNGTYVGERKIEGPTDLAHGDVIKIGPVLLIFRVSEAEEATPTDWSR